MMTESLVPNRETETLSELLSRQVRALSNRGIAVSIATGALAAASAFAWRPFGWRVWALGGFCAVTMGIWAIADGELHEDVTTMPRKTRVMLRIVCTSAATAGTLAALALAFTIVSVFIGTWRS